ncbi:Choline-sulfatase [Planctomycetes bacterium Poly30]|uniref:Choline-sulfatase n=1 Tax=Saltatorellus ferox TaxID=2528018 RepID=A0A518EU07_9BACT|nr:Choline-sulfatase [Planctomycetes bacterium Poly30]
MLTSLGFAAFVLAPLALTSWNGGPPNVVFIIADDLTAEALGAYGNLEVDTPHIDRLAQRGVTFDRAYCQYPVCAPSRASLLSGRYPPELGGANGSYTNLDSVLGSAATLPEHFRLNGYTAARVSKLYHMAIPGDITSGAAGSDHAPSWDLTNNILAPEWRTPGVAGHYTNETLNFDPNQHYGTGFGAAFYTVQSTLSGDEQADYQAATRAIERLDALQHTPFFLAVGFVRPHVPLVAPVADFQRYDPAQLTPADSVPGDLADIPSIGVFWNETARGPNSDADRREVLRAYYAAVSFMDAQVGRVLDRIDALGLADSTYIVFTSDHGYHLGEHTMWQKLSLHEESARVPLIVAGPGLSPGRSAALTEHVDLYPTLAELCGLGVPASCSGRSFVPVLSGSANSVRNSAFSMVGNGYLIRTEHWAYMRYSNGAEELYDMGAAPLGDVQQVTNQASNPAYAATLADLRARLEAKLHSFDDDPGEIYCAGDGQGGAGCPCFFFGQPGEGCLSSSGTGARLEGSGSPSVLDDTFRLTVTGGPPAHVGFMLQGLTPAVMVLGDGILCLNVGQRLPIQALDGVGATTYAKLGFTSLAGNTMHYQYVFRDFGPCGGVYNLSSAWRVTWY